MSSGKLFIISAPSGAGKSTILRRVMAELQGVAFSVSHTTRPPRTGEKDGREYHFIERATFLQMIEEDQFCEYAEVHGNLYGTSKASIQKLLARGVDVILDIDVQGAAIIRRFAELPSISVFLAPPSLAELERRLRHRGLDSDGVIATRLNNAHKEMSVIDDFDYLIINEHAAEAALMFEAIILATRARDRRGFTGQDLPDMASKS